jgi:hypothetical protein
MPYQPLQDRKFVALLVDVFAALVLYFCGKYASASLFDDIKVIFGLLQPLIAIYIAGQFQAEAVSIQQGILPKQFGRKP